MGFSKWLESTFSADKFNANKGLKHIRKDYGYNSSESNFDSIFLDLANEEINKQKRLLSIDEIERIAHRARIQARHHSRSIPKDSSNIPVQEEEHFAQDSMPRTVGTLSREIYDRLDKQLQTIKTTTNPLLSEGELGTVRNLKLKTAEENIQKIVQDLTIHAKARGINQDLERAYRLEITRWTELAKKTNARLDKKINSMDFKEYVNEFERSFNATKSKA